MEAVKPNVITVATTVNAPIEKVWAYWSEPKHITQWCQASADWHAPYADNDLRTGGKFKTTMASKDGSMSFDFEGEYTEVEEHKTIAYTIADGRKVKVNFTKEGNAMKIVESFEAENTHPEEMQRGGWQSILDSFKNYVENN
jgi:uncharacterized protein YndB with AHSA1/START domain